MDLKNLKDDIQKFMKKRSKNDSGDAGNVSMKDGNHGTIFGLNRKIVVGVFILFCTMFAISFIFASDDSKKADNNPRAKQQTDADINKVAHDNNLPNDYESLHALDKNKAGVKAQPQAGTVQAQKVADNASADGGSSSVYGANSTLPAVPQRSAASYSAPYQLPWQQQAAAPAPAVTATPVDNTKAKEEAEAQKLQNRLKAAINFAIGDKGIGGGSSATTDNEKKSDSPAQAPATATNGVMQTMAPAGGAALSAMSYTPASPDTLIAGTTIPVILCSGINTDAGDGQVIAQVQANVYDSMTGTNLLIPAGTRLVGSYATKASKNGRIPVTFTTMVLPGGGSYNIGQSMVAVDGAGYTGLQGKVNGHTGKALSGGMIGSAMAALGSMAAGNTSNTSNTYSGGQLAMQGAMSNLMNAASALFTKGASVTPTVTVEPGYQFSVYVTQAIALSALL